MDSLTRTERLRLHDFLQPMDDLDDERVQLYNRCVAELRATDIDSNDWLRICPLCLIYYSEIIAAEPVTSDKINLDEYVEKQSWEIFYDPLEAVAGLTVSSGYGHVNLVKSKFYGVYTAFQLWCRLKFGMNNFTARGQSMLSTFRVGDDGKQYPLTMSQERIQRHFAIKLCELHADIVALLAGPTTTQIVTDTVMIAVTAAVAGASREQVSHVEEFTAAEARKVSQSVLDKKQQEMIDKYVAAVKELIEGETNKGLFEANIYPLSIPESVYANVVKYFTDRGFAINDKTIRW